MRQIKSESWIIFLGQEARRYFIANVLPGTAVGLAGGSTVAGLVYALRRGDCKDIKVYPLATSPIIEAVAHDANTLVGTLAYRHAGYRVAGYNALGQK